MCLFVFFGHGISSPNCCTAPIKWFRSKSEIWIDLGLETLDFVPFTSVYQILEFPSFGFRMFQVQQSFILLFCCWQKLTKASNINIISIFEKSVKNHYFPPTTQLHNRQGLLGMFRVTWHISHLWRAGAPYNPSRWWIPMGVEPSQKRCLLEVVSKHHGPKHIEVVSRMWSDYFLFEGGKLPAIFLVGGGWWWWLLFVVVFSVFIGSTPEVFFNFSGYVR